MQLLAGELPGEQVPGVGNQRLKIARLIKSKDIQIIIAEDTVTPVTPDFLVVVWR